jgi:adenosyl cobinamide kinase/adenosyl cobinamide phosphate guanylyltransferase
MKLAWLVSGPSGSGKSTWIRDRATEKGARLIRHAVRTDRSLRQGRQYLFSQHRSKEPTLIWLEGADTLTTDAQAFLRRILETATQNVEFALEVRDEVTMNPPLLSRCQRICMPNVSFRKQQAIQQLEKRGYAELRKVRQTLEQKMNLWSPGFTVQDVCTNIQMARNHGYLPDVLLHKILKRVKPEMQVEVYKKFGDGINPWLLLTEIALKCVIVPENLNHQ